MKIRLRLCGEMIKDECPLNDNALITNYLSCFYKIKIFKEKCGCSMSKTYFLSKVDSSKESAEAACDILSQLVNCSLKTLGLISTARPSFMDLPKV